jgi:hypothetical protein
MGNNNNDIAPGLNFSFSAGFIVGLSWSGKLDPQNISQSLKNGSLSFGGTTPGVGASVTYAPKMLRFKIPCF